MDSNRTISPGSCLEIIPINRPLQASVRVPGSKSLTNRVLMVASLADGLTTLSNALFSDDSRYFAEALHQLGFEVVLDEEHCKMAVLGLGGRIPARKAELYIGNAGTAARFLTAFLTLAEGEFILDGDARMRERPIGDLVMALGKIGAKITGTARQEGAISADSHRQRVCLPLQIASLGLPGGKTNIAGDISSQFLSGILMAAPYAQKPVELTVTTQLNSRPYIDMTLGVMHDFGVDVINEGYEKLYIQPKKYQAKKRYTIEPDASAASYFFAAPAILGGSLRLENIRRVLDKVILVF